MGESHQVWDVPVSPRERLELFNLVFAEDPRSGQPKLQVSGHDEGKTYRRVLKAFGLVAIRDASLDSGHIRQAQLKAAPVRFRLTHENVTFVLKRVAPLGRGGGAEMVFGPLLDRLDDLEKGEEKASELAVERGEQSWAEIPRYDPAAENWRQVELEDIQKLAAAAIGQCLAAGGAPISMDDVAKRVAAFTQGLTVPRED